MDSNDGIQCTWFLFGLSPGSEVKLEVEVVHFL